MKSWLKKYHITIILLILLCYCGFLLFYKLGFQSFWIDEGYSSYVSKYMSINGLYKSTYFLFEWLQVLCFKLGGISDFVARFPSVIFHILSIFLMYLIPAKLCKNKYVGLLSAILFGFLQWELGWGRNARFYSLLQFLFLLSIFLIQKWLEKGSAKYLNFSILIMGLGMVFHPFLYCLGPILFLAYLSQYKKLWNKKSIFSKKYLSTRIIVLIGLIVVILYGTLWAKLKGGLTSGLSWEMKKYYFDFYNQHLRAQLGMIYGLGVIGMIWFIIRRKIKEIIFLLVPFILFVYALVIKGYLMHSRYALLMFPLLVISTLIFAYDIFKLLKNKYLKIIFSLIVIILIGFTAKFQFIPTDTYYFDYTSPQPDFKSAYSAIPDKSNVISGFPALCDWYYSDRGTCLNAVRVDLIHDGKTTIASKKTEKYTKLSYIDSLDELNPGVYYFVIDALTYNSYDMNGLLYDQIFTYGEDIFLTGEAHNNIVVIRVYITD